MKSLRDLKQWWHDVVAEMNAPQPNPLPAYLTTIPYERPATAAAANPASVQASEYIRLYAVQATSGENQYHIYKIYSQNRIEIENDDSGKLLKNQAGVFVFPVEDVIRHFTRERMNWIDKGWKASPLDKMEDVYRHLVPWHSFYARRAPAERPKRIHTPPQSHHHQPASV